MLGWTTFVSGDGYAGTDFSTRTSIVDTAAGAIDQSLEIYAIDKDGVAYRAADVNLWGVTFADDTRFYATMATGGRTHLVEGDVSRKLLRTLRENVECPSLSQDGTRLAFKKRLPELGGEQPWRLFVFDLRTGRETPLAENRPLDDQAEWLDEHTVLYVLPGDQRGDVWAVPADGTGRSRNFSRTRSLPRSCDDYYA